MISRYPITSHFFYIRRAWCHVTLFHRNKPFQWANMFLMNFAVNLSLATVTYVDKILSCLKRQHRHIEPLRKDKTGLTFSPVSLSLSTFFCSEWFIFVRWCVTEPPEHIEQTLSACYITGQWTTTNQGVCLIPSQIWTPICLAHSFTRKKRNGSSAVTENK